MKKTFLIIEEKLFNSNYTGTFQCKGFNKTKIKLEQELSVDDVRLKITCKCRWGKFVCVIANKTLNKTKFSS